MILNASARITRFISAILTRRIAKLIFSRASCLRFHSSCKYHRLPCPWAVTGCWKFQTRLHLIFFLLSRNFNDWFVIRERNLEHRLSFAPRRSPCCRVHWSCSFLLSGGTVSWRVCWCGCLSHSILASNNLQYLRDWELGKFSLREFFIRRSLRHYIASVFTFFTTFCIAINLFANDAALLIARSPVASVSSVSSLRSHIQSGYIDVSSSIKPLPRT